MDIHFIKNKSGDGEAEDGSDVHHRTIYLCLARTPFMVEKLCIAGTILSLGTHTLRSATCGVLAAVLKQFFTIDTLELAGRLTLQLVEALTQGAGKRTSLNLPELSYLHLRGVHLQCSSH